MSDEQRCGSCRWWGDPKNPDRSPWMYGVHALFTCRIIRHYEDEPARHGMDEPPDRRDMVNVSDGSGYHGALNTRADFGCVLWERKAGG